MITFHVFYQEREITRELANRMTYDIVYDVIEIFFD
jgi:hypothetical protein